MHICEFFHLVCVDVDILLNIFCVCGIDNIINNIQENVSQNEIIFKRTCTDTF